MTSWSPETNKIFKGDSLWASMEKVKTDKKTFNLGCGESGNSKEEFTIDIMPNFKPDLIWDLRKTPWPIEDNQFELVRAENIIEHFPDTCAMMEEIWRISKPGAIIKIIVPHYTGYLSWSCPEHYKTFSSGTFKYFDKQFDTVSIKLNYFACKRHKIIGPFMNFFINLHLGVSDRFGSLIGGIAEVETVLQVKKDKNLDRKSIRVNRPAEK